MALYWLESAVIGFLNIFRMIIAQGEEKEEVRTRIISSRLIQLLFQIPFFTFHFGIFMTVHGIFILTMFGPPDFVRNGIIIAILMLLISHGISFFTNFIGRKEYLSISPTKQMMSPYKRIMVMHLTIIFGGFMTSLLKVKTPALALMVIIKIIIDLKAHLSEHHYVLAKSRHSSSSVDEILDTRKEDQT
jgi:hypothetical protein